MKFTTGVATALRAAGSSWVQRLRQLEAKACALRGRLLPAYDTKKPRAGPPGGVFALFVRAMP
jgi:hypothetical protein